MLAHLAAVGVLHMAQHQAVFEGRAAEHLRGDGQQGVEPAAGLVDGLGNEIGREAGLELVLVFKRIVPLRKGHGAGIVPAVDDLLDAVHGLAAVRAAQNNLIDIGAMQLGQVNLTDGHIQQLLLAADDVHMAVLTQPDGQRGAPVTFARKAPVHHVFKEIAHAAFLDVVGHPVDGAVIGNQLIAHGGHADKPGGAGVIQQRGVAAPTEGIIMGEGHGGKKQAALLQILQNQGIGVLDEHARPGSFGNHLALCVHQIDERQAVFAGYAIIVLAECRGNVNDACTVGHGDVIVADDEPGFLIRLYKAIQRLILQAVQRGAGHFIQDFGLFAFQHRFYQRLGHDINAAFGAHMAVGFMGIDAQRQVAGQRPWGGSPGKQIGILLVHNLEANKGGFFLYVLIALGNLMAGQRGAAARAIGHDLVSLVDHVLFGQLLQAPPYGFDIIVMIGDVGVLHIHPEAHAVRHILPQVQVLPDALLALLDKGLDAVGFDLRLAVQTKLLFHLQLYRQAVGIPAGDAQHGFSLHGLIAGNQILDGAGKHMADMGLAVGGGRAVEKGKIIRAVAQVEALVDNIIVLPELEHFLFALVKMHVGCDFAVHLLAPFSRLYPKDRKSLSIPWDGQAAVPPKLTHSVRPLFACNGGMPRGISPSSGMIWRRPPLPGLHPPRLAESACPHPFPSSHNT